MQCSQCKYEMSEFDTECPKCHGHESAATGNESEFDRAIIDIIDSGYGVDDETSSAQTITLDETMTLPSEMQVVADDETAQPVTLKSGSFTIDESNTLSEDFNLPEEEFTFERNAPGGNALWIAAIYMFAVAAFGVVIYYIL